MNFKSSEILITGGDGMVGSSLKRIIPSAFFVSSRDFDLSYENETTIFLLYHQESILKETVSSYSSG
jgi:dTDP-4-dehydrorhamnose reductase